MAESLVQKYKTRDPFEIAKALGYVVILTPLKGVRGFYQFVKRCTIIYIDSALDEWESRFVCGHEIGHVLLHRGYNRIFLDTHTYFKVNTYEIEADRFAINLLYSDDDITMFFGFPVQILADSIGVSVELAEYRLNTVDLPTTDECP